MRRFVFSFILVLLAVGAVAQRKNGTVTGTVTDASSGEVVIGASIAL